MRNVAGVLLIALVVSGVQSVEAAGPDERRHLSVEWATGGSNSLPTPLTISQDGFPDISINHAHYDTNPFEGSKYYAYRFGLWKNKSAWEFEWVHNKIYLTDLPSTVQLFDITHGYNLLFVNRARTILDKNPRFSLVRRFGAGVVIAHPENIIRNQELPDGGGISEGYYLAGVAGQASLQGQLHLGQHVFLKAEGKLTGAWANVPVVQGSATVPTITLHGLVGLGARF